MERTALRVLQPRAERQFAAAAKGSRFNRPATVASGLRTPIRTTGFSPSTASSNRPIARGPHCSTSCPIRPSSTGAARPASWKGTNWLGTASQTLSRPLAQAARQECEGIVGEATRALRRQTTRQLVYVRMAATAVFLAGKLCFGDAIVAAGETKEVDADRGGELEVDSSESCDGPQTVSSRASASSRPGLRATR